MKKNRKGFTLIELLVVVLIIGILASVALPQYTKAVEKSRWMEAISNTKVIGLALERYLLANPGDYTTDMSALDISVGTPIDSSRVVAGKFRYTLFGSAGVGANWEGRGASESNYMNIFTTRASTICIAKLRVKPPMQPLGRYVNNGAIIAPNK